MELNLFKRIIKRGDKIHDDTEGPNIHFVGMADLALEDFGGDVVGGAADGFLLLAFKFQSRSQPEVAQLDLHFIVQEQVSELEVSVNDAVGDEVLKTLNNLDQVALDFQFGETFTSFKQFVEGLVLTDF